MFLYLGKTLRVDIFAHQNMKATSDLKSCLFYFGLWLLQILLQVANTITKGLENLYNFLGAAV